MNVSILNVTCRSAAVEIINQECYYCDRLYDVYLNGELIYVQRRENVFSLFQLVPETNYRLGIVFDAGKVSQEKVEVYFTTQKETAFLNVRRFYAIGDGTSDDTAKIQAAISSCPKGGTVYLPAGNYLCHSLFMSDDITLYLDQDACILGELDRTKYPILPGVLPKSASDEEIYLGSWEGNPLDCFAGLINVIDKNKVTITGNGTIDARADQGDWYINEKKKKIAWRPRMFFTSNAENVVLHGVTVKNSYSWTIHPMFSKNVDILDVKIRNRADSPNTDGINPESCRNVRIIGADIHVGDDCIALKSGKLYMGRTLRRPCENITIRNCLMREGHGGLVIGSEMSGGVKNVSLTQCVMDHTDRGLRIKTRRGRGKDARIEQLNFNNVVMKGVKTPFAINMFYNCDPDGMSDYVQSREPIPTDRRTPYLGKLRFENITATDAEFAGCCFVGLPEEPIRRIVLSNVSISFKEDAQEGIVIMAGGEKKTKKQAFRAENVSSIVFDQVEFSDYLGEKLQMKNVEKFTVLD